MITLYVCARAALGTGEVLSVVEGRDPTKRERLPRLTETFEKEVFLRACFPTYLYQLSVLPELLEVSRQMKADLRSAIHNSPTNFAGVFGEWIFRHSGATIGSDRYGESQFTWLASMSGIDPKLCLPCASGEMFTFFSVVRAPLDMTYATTRICKVQLSLADLSHTVQVQSEWKEIMP